MKGISIGESDTKYKFMKGNTSWEIHIGSEGKMYSKYMYHHAQRHQQKQGVKNKVGLGVPEYINY